MLPQFTSKSEMFEWLHLNKDLVIRQKKAQIKYADAVNFNGYLGNESTSTIVNKAEGEITEIQADKLVVKAVINTTNLMDSHYDVHLPNLWKKSLNENRSIIHLQEHEMKFDKVITDDLSAYTEDISWKDLGYDYEGKTQALVFESNISAERNPYMFEQYKKGRVRNHSVGMQYVKVAMAVNSEDKWFKEEKEVWDKYIDQVANKDQAEELGMFFAVTEAKVIEGSAVLIGSNRITPTISVTEATKGTSTNINQEPSTDTLDWNYIIQQLKS